MVTERIVAGIGVIALLVMLVGLCASKYPLPWYVKAARTGGAIVMLFALGSTALLLMLGSLH
jgi:hypothetical protein